MTKNQDAETPEDSEDQFDFPYTYLGTLQHHDTGKLQYLGRWPTVGTLACRAVLPYRRRYSAKQPLSIKSYPAICIGIGKLGPPN